MLLKRNHPRGGHPAARLIAALLLVTIFGCYCFRYEYVSFEDQPDFVVVERTTRPMKGSARTFPRVPTKYRVTRAEYELEVSTGGLPYPVLSIQAFAPDGSRLEISGPNMVRNLPPLDYGPRIPKGVKDGAWAFDVLRDGEKIGSETFYYEIRSRRIACGCDLP